MRRPDRPKPGRTAGSLVATSAANGGHEPSERSTANPESIERPFGFNLIGHITGNLGLGVVARRVAGIILANGFPLATHEVPAGMGRDHVDPTYASTLVDDIDALPYSINLIILGANSLRTFLEEHSTLLGDPRWLNAAAFFWELPTLPPRWLMSLDRLDVVVAMSDFLKYAYQFSLSGPLVISGRVPVDMPEGVVSAREDFDLPADKTIFVVSFEPHSDAERKNTTAVIDAFMQSVGNDESAFLVVKINNPNTSAGQVHPVLLDLRDRCAGHPRIRLMDRSLAYFDVLRLYKSCDVYVSLHRAEGLGLGMAEAMTLGLPVVATAWSGNMTFMDHENSCPVRYRLGPVQDTAVYRESQLEDTTLWAEPEIGDAAHWMKRLLDDPAMRLELGRAAQHSMQRYNEDASTGKFLRELQRIDERRATAGRTSHGQESDFRADVLKRSRLARIQQLEMELSWLKKQPIVRMAIAAKSLLRKIH